MLAAASRRFVRALRPVLPRFSSGFRVLGLQQIAIGGLDKKALTHFWGDIMGVKTIGNYKSEKENVDEDILVLGSPSASPLAVVELDLMQPLDPNKSPKVHEPALNHIGVWVDDINAAVTNLTAKGVRFAPGGIRKGAAGHLVAFIHPKSNAQFPLSAQGVLLELVQAPADVIAAFDGKK